ncbi:MAG: DUF3122 domain-containing protein [Thermostichales cyanobacterium DRC_bins_46]
MRILLSVLFWVWTFLSPATLIQQPEAPGQILIQSRHTLTDTAGHHWQAVLFRRWGSRGPEPLRLRLVGLGGTPEILHPRHLLISTVRGETWLAPDISEQLGEHPPRVGQYLLEEVVAVLDPVVPTQLSLSSIQGEQVVLRLFPGVIQEWQAVGSSSRLGTNQPLFLNPPLPLWEGDRFPSQQFLHFP